MSTLLGESIPLRSDGRRADELRPFAARMGIYQNADGSAMIRMGGTMVLCAVYGPQEPKMRSRMNDERAVVNCQYSMATFSTRERKSRPRGDRRSTEFRTHMQKCFESVIITDLYPRSQINIFCEIVQGDGSHLAACINAATLALSDAGIALRDLASAACCALVQTPSSLLNAPGAGMSNTSVLVTSGGTSPVTCIYDVSHAEEGGGSGCALLTMTMLPRTGQLVLLEMEHRVHIDHITTLINGAQHACLLIHERLVDALRPHVQNLAIRQQPATMMQSL